MAQLGARLNGIQEARGSIPLSSTKQNQGAVSYIDDLQPLFCSRLVCPQPELLPFSYQNRALMGKLFDIHFVIWHDK